MKNVKILGTGCVNCKTTYDRVVAGAQEKGVEIQIEKVEDIQKIMGFGVMSLPAIVIDGVVVHSGSVPTREIISGWF